MRPENQDVFKEMNICQGAFVAVVGAGGKSTLLHYLARESVNHGYRVLISSTTNLQPPGPRPERDFIQWDGRADLLQMLDDAFGEFQQVTVSGTDLRRDKIKGLEPEVVDRIHDSGLADVILIQADGARKRSFKAPASHEPVVPGRVTHGILVVGLDALGRPLDDEKVHRVEITARLAGQEIGSAITVATLERVITHPDAYVHVFPEGCARALYFSKADNPARVAAAESLARRIGSDCFDLVLWGDLRPSASKS